MNWGQIAAAVGGSALNWFAGREDREDAMDRNRESMEMAEKQMAMQREFAQHGLTWRVEDAKAAGLHPLAALGAASPNYSPVNAIVEPAGRGPQLRDLGQNLSRAITATATKEDRQFAALRLASAQADLDGKLVDNQIRASELARIRGAAVGPSMPVKVVPHQVIASSADVTAHEAGSAPEVTIGRADGGVAYVMPQSMSESYENDLLGGLQWQLRNRVLPAINPKMGRPSKEHLPPGYDRWFFDAFRGTWIPWRVGKDGKIERWKGR